MTAGENIADNGAIFQAFSKLPHPMSKYTKDQLFYIAFANTYCNNDSPGFLRFLLKHDTHSPFYARVTVPLQNSEQFAEAFKCKKGSQMNPTKKLLISCRKE
ncbi:neprilysin-4-like protein [Leptotrombidium deliense]|uniref:Neprilysin-4-like protein n=1 Tax=Leptotrombidium deliense TaxID=299467 RepID=A0A443SA97_9ACAR|nr:neprilysin-4-like protein [Leptotrombidium deliense]